MKGNYNTIAPFYDRLSRVFYGRAIVNAQKFLVEAISANSTILIIGGGTGWILEEITNQHAKGLQITYIDITKKMIELSMKRNVGSNNVSFVNDAVQHAPLNQMFDVVITPFLLDNFSFATAAMVFNKLHDHLNPNGLWLFADFQVSDKGNLWQKLLLDVMYLFFKLACNIEASKLPDAQSLFRKNGYQVVASKTFFRNFICSVIYQKAG